MSCELRKIRSKKLNRLKGTSDVLKISQNRWEEDMEFDKIKYYKFKKEEKEDILRRLKEFFEREERIKLAYIFGNFTRRNMVRDIDVAVYAVPAFSFSELVKLNVNVKQMLRSGCHSASGHRPYVQKVLRGGMPPKMKNDMHYALISQAFSELQDLKISKMLATCRKCSGLGLMPTKMQ